MPRIIFKCPYIKGSNNTAHLSNLVKYIATRDGVQKFSAENKNLPVTTKQAEFIKNILKEFPDSKNLFEYEDYKQRKTIENASDFIAIALEHSFDMTAKKENYVDYIANRPRVEKLTSHGLFTSGTDQIVLSKVAEEVAHHPGNIWTPIISLRREDSVSTGFNDVERWKDLLETHAPTIADNLKIPIEHFKWYAAFHNESHHPHIHMICYSADSRFGYLTKKGIEKIKSGLVSNIFQNEMKEIYAKQSYRREDLKAESKKILLQLITEMKNGNVQNPKLELLLLDLAEKLKHTKGKRAYGYLSPKLKNIVDSIVDELSKEKTIFDAYSLWYEMRNEVLKSYSDNSIETIPLSKQKEFKPIKNFIISEADKLSKNQISLLQLEEIEVDEEEYENTSADYFLDKDSEEPSEISDFMVDEAEDSNIEEPFTPYVKWSEDYDKARKFLFGTENGETDFEQAMKLFRSESEKGNVLAIFDIGRMYADGLGVEINAKQAQDYYAKALDGFMFVENKKPWKYTQYRIGKMLAQGIGTEQNYEEAADWFSKSSAEKYKFAEYSLGGLYYRGQGVEQNYERAFELYLRSAKQGFPYADFEVAKMFRDSIGTEKDEEQSDIHFNKAFIGFEILEKQNRDDKLQYRLGWMLQNGVGTETDIVRAKEYYKKSAKLGNVFSNFALAKLVLKEEEPNPEELKKAIEVLKSVADSEAVSLEHIKSSAEYLLGKLLLDGKLMTKNINKAIRYFKIANQKSNQWASYQLGKLYMLGKEVPKDIEEAIKYLIASSEQGNQFSQYLLGKTYLLGKEVPKDKEQAIKWLTLSSEQGNEYAKFFLKNIDKFSEHSMLFCVSRMMYHMGKVFEESTMLYKNSTGVKVDSKLLRKLKEKKLNQGNKGNEQEIIM